MNEKNAEIEVDDPWAAERFEIGNLEEEIQADRACEQLLRRLYLHLTAGGCPPEDAGALARGADYFLRDFIIADRNENILRFPPERVRQFAGNWYIVRNLEPNPSELAAILTGIRVFFDFAEESGGIGAQQAEQIRERCADFEFYCSRIEQFAALEGDGYLAWKEACPLENR